MKNTMIGIALFGALALNAPATANEMIEKGYTGNAYSEKSVFCGNWFDFSDIRDAIKAGSAELVEHLLKNSDCVMTGKVLNVIVVDTGDDWAKVQIKGDNGKFLKAYTLRFTLKPAEEL